MEEEEGGKWRRRRRIMMIKYVPLNLWSNFKFCINVSAFYV